MSFLILQIFRNHKSSLIFHNPGLKIQLLTHFYSSLSEPGSPSYQNSSTPFHNQSITASRHVFLWNRTNGPSSLLPENLNIQCGSVFPRLLSSQAAVEQSTSDGLTVEGIIANGWIIYDENESDWKSHASAIAQSIHLIKKRLKWKKLKARLEILSEQLDKPDLWDDPVHAGKISREHGSLMGKMKEVNAFEKELLEHIDMIKLAREENDEELELVGSRSLPF